MSQTDACFTAFTQSIAEHTLPTRFTFPFYYDPHPLCILAAEQLQQHLASQHNWQHNFGLTGQLQGAIGKMFGVLLVENVSGEIGFLAAFSGKLAESNHLPGFVPPVFDLLNQNSFFLAEQAKINQVNQMLESLESDPRRLELMAALYAEQDKTSQALDSLKQQMAEDKKMRKQQRAEAEKTLPNEAFMVFSRELDQKSIQQKLQLRDLKLATQTSLTELQSQLNEFENKIAVLAAQRKKQSSALQQAIFAKYQFLNASGEVKNLNDIFVESEKPAGAGECAAPKLLHYAFNQGFKPLAMAEFWWGASPKSEVRQHQNFYPACLSKCQPILSHMLQGLEVDDNPLLVNPAEGLELSIIYQDDVMLVINKPAEFLSVPGKSITDSVYTRIKAQFQNASGPLIVHRLDMSTSGLMVIALNKRSHQALQKQFILRTVTKRYAALLDGELSVQSGDISLPLRVDLADRPRQMVCYEHGKAAHTYFEVISHQAGRTKVHLYPKTGRTHQLRVHCAHTLGLNTPIVGDDLYGKKEQRLHLHAELLALAHPITGEVLTFIAQAPF